MSQVAIPPELVECLDRSECLVVMTGAGISAESGVPTFRDAQTGLWARFRPEQLATVEAFAADPGTVWSWYEWRRDLVERAAPNAGHLALAALELLVPDMMLVTQNVDGLHRRAGSRQVVEFHGNLFANHCLDCSRQVTNVPRPCPAPPRCPLCGGLVRPGVVWFGEAIPEDALAEALHATDSCDLFMSIGTSALVHPAAGLAARAKARGAALVEINPQATELARIADFAVCTPAGEALPALLSALEARRRADRTAS